MDLLHLLKKVSARGEERVKERSYPWLTIPGSLRCIYILRFLIGAAEVPLPLSTWFLNFAEDLALQEKETRCTGTSIVIDYPLSNLQIFRLPNGK